MQWKSLETANGLDLLNWVWMKIGTTVTPITTDADYTPVDLKLLIFRSIIHYIQKNEIYNDKTTP